ncbi:MAG TPA: hypothetical protein VFV99_21130 [Kofleriaceae bacterium]|nr:hypothetical protein [Kofleriaceae bacterium]
MRTLLPIAVVLAMGSPARADGVDPQKVASRWLDAARAGSAKQLAALTAPSLIVTDVHSQVSTFCIRRMDIGSRARLVRAVRDFKVMFADTAGWQRTEDARDQPVCPAGRKRGRDTLVAKPGEHDVTFEGGAGVGFVVRVSKAGRVVFVGKSTVEGDH